MTNKVPLTQTIRHRLQIVDATIAILFGFMTSLISLAMYIAYNHGTELTKNFASTIMIYMSNTFIQTLPPHLICFFSFLFFFENSLSKGDRT